jgi:hypothetical protein
LLEQGSAPNTGIGAFLVLSGVVTQYCNKHILLIFVSLDSVKYKEEDGEDFLLCQLFTSPLFTFSL